MAQIDVLVAGINAEAARIVALAAARSRSARDHRLISGHHGNSTQLADTLAQLEREEQVADEMTSYAQRVRDEAAQLQRLAHDMRRNGTAFVA